MIELFARQGRCSVCGESRIVHEIRIWQEQNRTAQQVTFHCQCFCLKCMSYAILSFLKTDMEKDRKAKKVSGFIDEDVQWTEPISPPHRLLKKM